MPESDILYDTRDIQLFYIDLIADLERLVDRKQKSGNVIIERFSGGNRNTQRKYSSGIKDYADYRTESQYLISDNQECNGEICNPDRRGNKRKRYCTIRIALVKGIDLFSIENQIIK